MQRALLALVAAGAACATTSRMTYPETRRSPHVDVLHGVEVADPYRWLEDPDSEETRAWVDAQNAVTFGFLEGIAARGPIGERLTQLWDYERWGVPYQRGGRYFVSKNDGLQDQPVLYVLDGLAAEPRKLIDPNTLSEDGTVALHDWAPSRDGSLLAYGIAESGSDWVEWRVRDVTTGENQADHIRWTKFSGVSWTQNGDGFYYSRYDEPKAGDEYEQANYYQKLYFHRLGTAQGEDTLVYERPDEREWGFGGHVTDDGRYLIITVWKGTDNTSLVFYRDLSTPEAPIVELLPEWEAEYRFIDNDGPVFWFKTDLDAPRGRVIAIDTRDSARDKWVEVIAEQEDTLQSVDAVADRFATQYLHHAHDRVRLFSLRGEPQGEVALPGIGSVWASGARRSDREAFYAFTGFTTPTTIYRYDFDAATSAPFKTPTVDFDPSAYETEQVFYTSPDGTRIPMFISRKKGLTLDGARPTLLYGYGGFNIPITPSFSVSALVWMEMGGVYAVANLRGGGEYGQAWHDGGRLDNKQNVFDDFIAAAEWLVDKRYTRPDRLAIHGRSNGGLLVGACMLQRPDLFAAALPAVGVMDMLRFHKFTIGWAWIDDYGNPDEADDFRVLYAYSPYHNLEAGKSYPATLVTTADHDDRVLPGHSFKFISALQRAQGGPAPTFIRIETKAGHGATTPTSKRIEEVTDQFAFLVRVLDMQLDLP